MSKIRGSHEGDAVALLHALIETPSVNPSLEPGGSGEAEIAALCLQWLRDWGFDVEVVGDEDRPSLVARHGSGSPTLLYNGHLDTVGVADMTVPPFRSVARDGRITGRGACDMKGGVAALLAAARALAHRGHGGTLVVALTADEEHASVGMQQLVDEGLRADAAVVCEPTGLAVMPAHKGFVWVEARFAGRAAHGSRPEVGIDAIRHAGAFLTELDALEAELVGRPPHPLLGVGSIHAGTIQGGTAPSVYPERCNLLLERRTLPGETAERVTDELEAAVLRARAKQPALRVELQTTLDRPGTEVREDHPLVTGLLASAARVGVDSSVAAMTAWVDAAWLNGVGVPAVCYGPGSIEQAHSADEWVEADEVRRCAAVLEDFGRTFLSS
jgi:acetylornithine deacetylase